MAKVKYKTFEYEELDIPGVEKIKFKFSYDGFCGLQISSKGTMGTNNIYLGEEAMVKLFEGVDWLKQQIMKEKI